MGVGGRGRDNFKYSSLTPHFPPPLTAILTSIPEKVAFRDNEGVELVSWFPRLNDTSKVRNSS